jgi:hypothetical protein
MAEQRGSHRDQTKWRALSLLASQWRPEARLRGAGRREGRRQLFVWEAARRRRRELRHVDDLQCGQRALKLRCEL